MTPAADSLNRAGGLAYGLDDESALAQLACTGTLEPTFYAGAPEQRGWLVYHGTRVSPAFLAKTAIFARQHGLMKATPALLCALLVGRDGALLERIFPRVIDNGRMLRSFVGHLRSGVLGRRSLGRRPKRLVQSWFDRRDDDQILRASVGRSPSLADVIRLAHVAPRTSSRRALFRYLLGRDYVVEHLPALVQALLRFQATGQGVPPVPFQRLTGVPLDQAAWRGIALRAGWQMTRMNLNTFARHGAFSDPEVVALLAERLSDPQQVARARQLPVQLMLARDQLSDGVPPALHAALEVALEHALSNVPELPGPLYVAVDVSGSMHIPLAPRGKTRCLDVAALFAAALLRRNPRTVVIPFHDRVVPVQLDAQLSVSRLASRIAGLPSGGTSCSAPVAWLNDRGAQGRLVVLISDNMSWSDASVHPKSTTPLMREWRRFQQRSPDARLACIDLQPYRTVQGPSSGDVLHVGGFSDAVFDVLRRHVAGTSGPDGWHSSIEEILL